MSWFAFDEDGLHLTTSACSMSNADYPQNSRGYPRRSRRRDYHWIIELFAVSTKGLNLHVHGLIFETSISRLAGSTRYPNTSPGCERGSTSRARPNNNDRRGHAPSFHTWGSNGPDSSERARATHGPRTRRTCEACYDEPMPKGGGQGAATEIRRAGTRGGDGRDRGPRYGSPKTATSRDGYSSLCGTTKQSLIAESG